MANKPIEIPSSKRAMRAQIVALASHVRSLELQVEKLRWQLGQLKRMQFGSSSEQLAREITQMELALESLEREAAAQTDRAAHEPLVPTPDTPVARLARHPGRKPLPAHLPREEVLHGLGHERDCRCSICGGTLRRAGQDETSEQLEWVPGLCSFIDFWTKSGA